MTVGRLSLTLAATHAGVRCAPYSSTMTSSFHELGAAALDFACGEAMRASSTFILARLDNSRSFQASSGSSGFRTRGERRLRGLPEVPWSRPRSPTPSRWPLTLHRFSACSTPTPIAERWMKLRVLTAILVPLAAAVGAGAGGLRGANVVADSVALKDCVEALRGDPRGKILRAKAARMRE